MSGVQNHDERCRTMKGRVGGVLEEGQHLVILECHFSWQAQHLVMLECHFSWQAQYFVKFGPRSAKSNLGEWADFIYTM